MAFTHKPARSLEYFTEKSEFEGRIALVKSEAEERRWQYWYREYPVHMKMVPLLSALEEAIPNTKIIPIQLQGSEFMGSLYWKAFSIVMEGQPFILGTVTYGDLNRGVSRKETYGIVSRKIRNEKYGSYQSHYYVSMPQNVDSAIKQARKFITPYTNLEIIDVLYPNIKDRIHWRKDMMQTRMRELIDSSGFGWSRPNPSELIVELKNIKDSGLKCVTPAFIKAMNGIDEAHELMLKIESYNPTIRFVRIEAGSDPVVHVSVPTTNENILSYGLSSLPQDVMERVAVLQILERSAYVEDIGYKYDNNIFFIEQEG